MDNRRIVIVDDHEIFRDGLRLVLNQVDNFEVVDEFASGDEFTRNLYNEALNHYQQTDHFDATPQVC